MRGTWPDLWGNSPGRRQQSDFSMREAQSGATSPVTGDPSSRPGRPAIIARHKHATAFEREGLISPAAEDANRAGRRLIDPPGRPSYRVSDGPR